MKNILKMRIQQFANRLLRRLEKKVDLNYQLNEDSLALNQLLRLFDNNIFVPLTKWSISPKEVLHICNDLVINKRTNIIEFGCGFSTLCIAQLLKNNRIKASFVTIDNDIEWTKELTKILKRLNLEEFVKIIVAPISEVEKSISKNEQELWYDFNILNNELINISNFDLVIVDGPIGAITPYARYSAVPFLKEKLSDNYAIFLDDTHRDIEFEIAHEWHKSLGGEIKGYNRYYCLTNKNNFNVSPFGNKY
ncbi:class I SAM-dependent methyltransferase [Yeosuana marina]|uniref:class I SAM-dependent methyltransferase n=1 Tax=Yeosuana marina TaxID=1565536 RepID=UPI0030EF75FE|tara:strand:+ start:407 stop:1156 length:750 start_codon:yes stop_codon:yes gene_type:complete